MSYIIRPWALRDLKDLVRLIQEAAAFHKALDQVKTTPKGHTIVGYQFHYSSYCTWERWILFGEDLYVMPEFRGRGIGTSLLNQVAKIALASGYTQFRFMSANWNQPATAFYENLGAVNVSARDSWNVWHMEGQRKIAAWVTQ
ncbi:thialysine N-epsilon-acetyltransferase-like isoform X2 [Pelodiscus sinensis]|uniref:thialysine N-epsilon-acetyltransferase-like isoform X2 n=1 Tax=Pelodiscus sinensis TaxID=13735 RepID=UPI003F6C5169